MLRGNVLAESNPKPKPNNQTGAHRSKDSNLALGVPKTYLVLYFCSMANDKNLAIMDHKNHAKTHFYLGGKNKKKKKKSLVSFGRVLPCRNLKSKSSGFSPLSFTSEDPLRD